MTYSRFLCLLCCCVVSTLMLAKPIRADDTKDAKKAVPATKVAQIVLKGVLPETAGAAGIFSDLEPSLHDMVRRIDRAAKDEKVAAVVLRIDGPSLGRGKLAEFHQAIDRLRKAGKKVVAEVASATTTDYLLACACDEIIMPESGTLMIPGVRAEVTYFAGLFEKLGIEADMMQVGDFKGAAEPFTRKGMSEPFRKQYELLIDDIYDQMVQTIADRRKLDQGKVKRLIDAGLFTAKDAQKAGLIDHIAYDDQTQSHVAKLLEVERVELVKNFGKKKVDTDFSGMLGFIKLFEMMMGAEPSQRVSKNKKIAMVHAIGPITTGKSAASLFGSSTVGSATIVQALREAKNDKSVVAIVLRVDSPGGSALASDLIWREIQQIEKPVIASMGDVAASGGYYISMGCDKIFAEPGTLTGSIGVVGGKIALGGLFDKAGVNTEVISRGKNSGLLSTESKFTATERAAWKKSMEDVYRQFTEKAAKGRKMKLDSLQGLAGGRVWTGRQAKENGLIDELGTLHDALAAAKEEAGMAEEEKAELLLLPRPANIFDSLLGVSAPGLRAKETADALVPGGSRRLSQLEYLRKLLDEPAVMIMPYEIQIK